ncbi:hypothetical protein T01_6428 [Trichinella spiralis]|uniref:Uncharacterized protein n=1 Tax=Trichinella spiralis TaxID=6334 RepID=A0A0V1BGQ4_TRISP|nr:hypothetical protein T01_6428 [Trichinella spiralis]
MVQQTMKSLPFGVPMVWREPQNYVDNCYYAWSKNTCHQSLINPEKVLLSPLYIKLGIMKQFVIALDKNGTCFQYLCTQFPLLSDAKLEEGISVGPDVQKLIKDKMFSSTMTQVEKEAWVAFTNVVSEFLGKKKDPEYGRFFPQNLGDVSEEQGDNTR